MRYSEYVVKCGDTLGNIAKEQLGDWNLYKKIQEINNLESPDKIEVGQVLLIPLDTKINDDTFIDKTTYKLEDKDYYKKEYKKDLIVLHFTAGPTASSAYNTFMEPGHVATAYLVGRHGKVYEMFDPRYWAYHLGKLKNDPTGMNSKRSIGIEIVNVGPLAIDKDNPKNLNWWPNNYGRKYCEINEPLFIKSSEKDKHYYATFTDDQYKSIAKLLKYLSAEFDIPLNTPDDHITADVKGYSYYKGILAHQHFRSDKYDMGPAYGWDKLFSYL